MRLTVNGVTVAATLLGLGQVEARDQATRQIAIVGAGAAGSSTAYFLQQFAAEAGVHVNVTLFEKTDLIGGRTRTINPFNDPAQRVEQGASIFIEANQIMFNAMKEFGLSEDVPDADADSQLGVWDGDSFVFTIDENSSSWWNTIKVVWKYGLTAPRRARDLTAATIASFLRIYSAPFFPFQSLTQVAQDLNLSVVTGVTGEQLLGANNIDVRFSHDLIQASTRVNYASNLANIHGLDTMVSWTANGATSVKGGNWQIFFSMAQRSRALLALNTSVVGIQKTPGGSQYTLQTTSSSTPDSPATYPGTFDNVVLANPYQFSGISAGSDVLESAIEKVPYVRLHVTHFTSPSRLSPGFFNLPSDAVVPGMVLTTLAQSDTATSGADGVGKAGFFSLSMHRKAINPQTQQKEHMYKIFSPEAITPEFLSRLLGAEVPATFTGGSSPISWYNPYIFHSYPKTSPRTTFQGPIVGEGVYYTSGMESFISTMETNALMGKNVARLIVDDIMASRGSAKMWDGEEGEKQKVMS